MINIYNNGKYLIKIIYNNFRDIYLKQNKDIIKKEKNYHQSMLLSNKPIHFKLNNYIHN